MENWPPGSFGHSGKRFRQIRDERLVFLPLTALVTSVVLANSAFKRLAPAAVLEGKECMGGSAEVGGFYRSDATVGLLKNPFGTHTHSESRGIATSSGDL